MKGTVRTLKTFRKVSNSHLYTIDYRLRMIMIGYMNFHCSIMVVFIME